MPEKEPLPFQRPEIKIVSPLERITNATRGIAKLSELDELQTAHLRRYANVSYRVREIRNFFSNVWEKHFEFATGEIDKYGDEICINVTRENYYLWVERLNEIKMDMIKTYFDKNSKMTIARIEVEQVIGE